MAGRIVIDDRPDELAGRIPPSEVGSRPAASMKATSRDAASKSALGRRDGPGRRDRPCPAALRDRECRAVTRDPAECAAYTERDATRKARAALKAEHIDAVQECDAGSAIWTWDIGSERQSCGSSLDNDGGGLLFDEVAVAPTATVAVCAGTVTTVRKLSFDCCLLSSIKRQSIVRGPAVTSALDVVKVKSRSSA